MWAGSRSLVGENAVSRVGVQRVFHRILNSPAPDSEEDCFFCVGMKSRTRRFFIILDVLIEREMVEKLSWSLCADVMFEFWKLDLRQQ